MVEGEGFEPSKHEAADLQSAGFDRSPIPPFKSWNFGDFEAEFFPCQLYSKLCYPYTWYIKKNGNFKC